MGRITPEMSSQIQQSFIDKTTANVQSGLYQYRDGNIKPFTGFNEDVFRRRFEVALTYDDYSSRLIQTKIVEPLEALARQFGIQAVFAGKGDFAPHSTLQIGDIAREVDPDAKETKEQFLNSNFSHLHSIANILAGEQVTFDTLVLAGSNMYICMTNVLEPSRQLKKPVSYFHRARLLIERIYEKNTEYRKNQDDKIIEVPIPSLAVPTGSGTYYNVLHASVGRITAPASSESLTAFAEKTYQEIGSALQQEPLVATISEVFVGTAYDHAVQRNISVFS